MSVCYRVVHFDLRMVEMLAEKQSQEDTRRLEEKVQQLEYANLGLSHKLFGL